MDCCGLPNEMLSIIIDIYEGSSFKVQTGDAETEEIPQGQCVKQGCALHCNPLVFNLPHKGLICGIKTTGTPSPRTSGQVSVLC